MGDDDLSFLEELVCYADAFIQQATRIAAQIEHHALEFAELLQGIFYFLFGGFVECADVHVTDAWPDQELEVHTVARDLIPDNVKFKRLVRGLPQNGDMHVRAFGALEHVGHVTHAQIVGGLAVDGNDYVSGAQTGFVGRSAGERSHNNDLVIAWRNLHAHAVILAALLFAHQRVRLGIKEIRVRIEDVKHARDGAVVYGFVSVDRFGVILLHQAIDLGELTQTVTDVRVRGAGSNAAATLAKACSEKTTHNNDETDEEE